MSTNLCLPWSRFRRPSKRRLPSTPMCAEICEERLLLSATAATTGQARSNPSHPTPARATSTGGPNGTAFLSPSLTPQAAVQIPGTAIMPDALATATTNLGLETPNGMTPTSAVGNVPTVLQSSFDPNAGTPQFPRARHSPRGRIIQRVRTRLPPTQRTCPFRSSLQAWIRLCPQSTSI